MQIGPIGDGEAYPHQRDILGPGDQLAVAIADEHIHRLILDLLVQEEGVSLQRLAVGSDAMHLFSKLLVGGAGQGKDGIHAHLHCQAEHAYHCVRVSEDCQALAVEVGMSIGHHVHQAAPLVFYLLGNGHAHEAGDVHHKGIGIANANGHGADDGGNLELALQDHGSGGSGRPAQRNGGAGVGGVHQIRDGSSAGRIEPTGFRCQRRI
ncbi:Uncharacterised protein [uncultured archaeon]|nr:Uncharacterised protein [uncultured archaeon]